MRERLLQTPSQTAGPFVHIGCAPAHAGLDGPFPDLGRTMVSPGTNGERITLTGCIFDGAGAVMKDALVEIWQADAAGLHPGRGEPRGAADPHFTGFGRCACDGESGEFRFETIRPGAVPYPDGRMMAPHITFWIVARGINTGLHTRMYFPEDDLSNDPLLARIEHRDRIRTLVAQKTPEGYRFEIRLQGADETVFFDM
jgi:protocatechuate 3,4-dioxygenase, alpha subunit